MIDLESARLPSLQTGELVTMPIDKGNKTVNSSENIVAKCGLITNNETSCETHLKPVVIRGTTGLNLERNHKVRLPPINVNLQVRDLLINNERPHKKIEKKKSQSEPSMPQLNIKDKRQNKPTLNVANSQKRNRAFAPKQHTSSENCGDFHFSQITATQKSKRNKRNSRVNTDYVERAIAMNEYSVLPPIGKHVQLPEMKEIRKAGENETKQALPGNGKAEEEDKDSFSLGEALEHFAKEYDANNEAKLSENVNNEEANKSKEKVNTLRIQPSVTYTKTNKYKDEQFTAIDNTLRNEREVKEDDSSLQKHGRQDSKRERNYYSDDHIQDENERKCIRKMRKQGRRFAVCEEMDAIYRDLAVIVKHNLLIQHLEEICIF